ncbi:MAG: NAD(P)-binding protein, partial [Pseudomonadota bacterium]|nr:NAD(P)-binding protein [Pseudomonadota bacterium]
MFVDATSLPDGEPIDTDICIVGAGAAGITMARELAGSRYSVALLESGGLELDARTQSLYEGKNTGIPTFDLQVNRLRFFGGTTNHWAGHCRLLDPIDFERRDWVPHSGWPISHHELGPYYTRAQPICGLGPARYEDLNYFTECTGLPALPLDGNRLKTAVYNQSPPTRFGKEYRNELRRAHNVIVYLKANVLELVTNP